MENKFVIAVKGIVFHDEKALILQRSADDEIGPNSWEFAGGKVEFGEALEAALIREIKEESGLIVTTGKLLYAATFKTNEHRQVVILSYLCTASDDIVSLSREHKDYLWANKAQMLDLLPKPIIDDLNNNSVWEYIK